MPHLFAYLDLASGSMIIQGAIAGIVAVPILFRNQIRRLLGRSKPAEDVVEEMAVTTPDIMDGSPTETTDPARP